MENSRYRVLARCLRPQECARIVHESDLDYRPDTLTDARIEELCKGLRASGRRVERLPVYQVDSWQADDAGLELRVGHTDYGVALAQRLHPEWWPAPRPTLAVCALTLSEDHAVVEHRSASVAISAGLIHVKPSGNLQPPEQPLEGLLREAFEELELTSAEVGEAQLLGLALCHGTLLDLIYRWECRRPLGQLLERAGADAWEHERLVAVDCRAEPLARWCRDNYLTCSPPGHAALVLEGRRRYGEEWFAEVWAGLTT